MQYQVQRQNPLGGLIYISETSNLAEAIAQVKDLNRNQPPYYKAYPAYIFDKYNYRAIKVNALASPYWCIWVGGDSWSIGDAEYFSSIQAIKDELYERLTNQRRYPCVDERSYFQCYAGEMSDCPDFIIKFGKRGGIVKERC